MTNNSPNCFHLLNSQYIKKEARHACLIKGVDHDGWLIPLDKFLIAKEYDGRYQMEQVYDSIMAESAKIQKLYTRKCILKDIEIKIFNDILRYANELKLTVPQLQTANDTIAQELFKEYSEKTTQIQQLERELAFERMQAKEEKKEDVDLFQTYSFLELLSMPPKEWLLDQVFGSGDLGVIYGPSGCGKTFVTIDMILRLCSGKRFGHRFRVIRPLNVLYCAGEGYGAMGDRFKVAAKNQNITDLSNFQYLKMVPQLFEAESPTGMLAFINNRRDRKKIPIDLLVIDTLHSSIAGADENSAQHMGKIIQSCQTAQRELGCAVLLLHHTNKDESSERGSSALRGACDFMIKIRKDNDALTNAFMECAKNKDGELWQPQGFNLGGIDGFNSVHVIWDTVGSSKKFDDTNQGLMEKILELLDHYPDEKFTYKRIAEAVGKSPKDISRLLVDLFDSGKCDRTTLNSKKNSPNNPWVYFKKTHTPES